MKPVEAVLDPLFEEVSDGVCASNDDGGIVYMNPAAERILEIRLTEARGKSLCDLLCGRLSVPGSPECASQCPLREKNSGQDAVTYQGEYNRRVASIGASQASVGWRNGGTCA